MVFGHARSGVIVNLRIRIVLSVHVPVILIHAARNFQQAVRAALKTRQHEVLFGPCVRLNGKIIERYRLVRPKVVLRSEPYLPCPHVRRVVVISAQRLQDIPVVVLQRGLYEVPFRLHFHFISGAVRQADHFIAKGRERAEVVRYLIQRELAVLKLSRVAVAAFVHPEEDARRGIVLEGRADIDQIIVHSIDNTGPYPAIHELAVFVKRRGLVRVRAGGPERRPGRLLINNAVHYPPAACLREVGRRERIADERVINNPHRGELDRIVRALVLVGTKPDLARCVVRSVGNVQGFRAAICGDPYLGSLRLYLYVYGVPVAESRVKSLLVKEREVRIIVIYLI